MPNAVRTPKTIKVAVVALVGLLATFYVAGYFFLWSLKLSPYQASPLTVPRYAHYYWHRPAVRHRLVCSLGAAGLLIGGMGLIALLPRRRRLHGEARWASAGEIRRSGLHADTGILLGKFRNRYLTFPGQTGVILAAPPRSGKGVSCVVPNLLNWPGSVLVLDIKKENWTLTAGYRSLFSEVYLFDPFAADGRTARWNPLSYVSTHPYLRIDDIQRIATMLCQEVAGADPFWVKSARSLFVGIALYLFERRDYERAYNEDLAHKHPMPEVPVTVGEILRQAMATDEEGFSKHWKRIIEGWEAMNQPLSPQCVSLIMDVVDLHPSTASSVRKTFTSQLDLWLNPLLDMATSTSDFDLRDLRKKKISIYLGIKPRDFERLQVVMNVFFQQAIGEQTSELPEHNPALKYQLLVALDEFTAVGRIPILLSSIAFIPGYNVRTLMVIQTPSQLDEVYGPNGTKIMLKTLAARIVFAPNDIEDARKISEELGYTTVKGRSRSEPGFGAGRQRGPSTTFSDQRRALLLPQEIKAMPADQEILFVEHLLPVRCKKIRYYDDKLFASRILPPPRVKAQDVSRYSGGRMDDHFAMWQQRIRKGQAGPAPAGVAPPEANRPIAVPTHDIAAADDAPARRDGSPLTKPEMDVAVNAFLDDLEST